MNASKRRFRIPAFRGNQFMRFYPYEFRIRNPKLGVEAPPAFPPEARERTSPQRRASRHTSRSPWRGCQARCRNGSWQGQAAQRIRILEWHRPLSQSVMSRESQPPAKERKDAVIKAVAITDGKQTTDERAEADRNPEWAGSVEEMPGKGEKENHTAK